MIITIAGQAGAGKGTVSRLLAKALGYKHYSMGDLRRQMASQRGMSLAEFNELGEAEVFTDKEVDDYQRTLGATEDDFVMDSRLGWFFIPNSVKIYLVVQLKEAARRVLADPRPVEPFTNQAQAMEALLERERSDKKRYAQYYGIDPFEEGHYDLVIDTTKITAEETVKRILAFLRAHGKRSA
ncbi:MAG TPA: cytidylate kinase family protein [archaeon]|nr:cytidylate kinase family protein [archaeon]